MNYLLRLKHWSILLIEAAVIIGVLSGCANMRKSRMSYVLLCDNPPETTLLELEQVTPTPILQSNSTWVVGMDGDSYSNLLINLHRIKSQLSQHRAVIQYYQSCVNEFKQQH